MIRFAKYWHDKCTQKTGWLKKELNVNKNDSFDRFELQMI